MTAAGSTTANRLRFVDTMKAIGIVLVVVGHVPGTPTAFVVLIYSVHMPLFFFASGYLLTPVRLAEPLPDTLRRAARTLLVPYLFFFAVSLVYWLLTRNLGDRAVQFANFDIHDALISLLAGRSSDLFINQPLWFFPTMFVCILFYAAAHRLLSAGWLFVLFLLLAISLFTAAPRGMHWPWGLDIAFMALVFYAFGHWLRCAHPLPLDSNPITMVEACAMAILFLVWAGLALGQGRVDLATGHVGEDPLIYVICALAGIGWLFLLSRRIAPNVAMLWLSANTLIIFPLHGLTLNLGSGIVKFLQPAWVVGLNGAMVSILFAVWAIAAVVPAVFVLRRYAPQLLGQSWAHQRNRKDTHHA